MFWARILPTCVECKYNPRDSTICFTCLDIYSVVNTLHIVSTEDYVCNACRSSASAHVIHRFPITQIFNYKFQILTSSTYDIWELVQNCRTFIKIKLLFLNNWWTCLFLLGNFRGTHNCSELSVVYLVDLIWLSHLQLISPF